METVKDLLGILDFASVYGLIKCLKTMMVGTLCLCVIMAIRKFLSRSEKYKKTGIRLYIMLMLLPAAFTGMSRFFYIRGTEIISALLCYYVKSIHGKIYFTVCAVLIARFLWNHMRMRKMCGMNETEAYRDELRACMDCVTASDCLPFKRWYLSRVRIFITDNDISPFSGGIFRPYVVMPRIILREWDEESRRLVLCHELTHICSGHVVMLTIFRLLEIYWWINPLIHMCTEMIRDDIEFVCDEQCLAYTKASPGGYGRVMLDMLGIMRSPEPEGTPAFMRKDDFQNMKERLENLRQTGKNGGNIELLRAHRKFGIWSACAALLFAAAVVLTSYPRYTIMKELVLYDEKLNMIDYDSEGLRAAVQVKDGRLIIDEERFGELIDGMEVEGDYVYLSFDTIMKVPGCGGCGNVGMISVNDYEDIWYLAADCVENRVREFWLKYLL